MTRKSGPFNTPDTEPAGDWRNAAACADGKVDPELFFPVGSTKQGKPGFEQARLAKAVCARCDVMEICARYALENHENIGIWGGMTEDERRAIRRRSLRQRVGRQATSDSGAIL